ncbi:MAG: hypothetical protein A2148_04435 [Chloroflexi bacterium RBG_16_68_14]|nr:MAG: hypothetical protein A2148_04435 [Chloroflexi bacterium RBG_16_68_14]
MANLSAVVFDYYETLAEISASIRERIFDDLAQRVGLDLAPGEAYRHWRELTTRDWVLRLAGQQQPPLDGPTPPFVSFREVWLERSRQLFERWGVDAPAELGADAYAGAHASAAVYADAPPALTALQERYRLAVLSDADSGFLASSMERNGLAFEAVVASEEVRAYKPHVSMFREVCARLGVEPSSALYVGDSPWADIQGARHAGMRAVWVNRHGVTWPEDMEPPEAEIRSLDQLDELSTR